MELLLKSNFLDLIFVCFNIRKQIFIFFYSSSSIWSLTVCTNLWRSTIWWSGQRSCHSASPSPFHANSMDWHLRCSQTGQRGSMWVKREFFVLQYLVFSYPNFLSTQSWFSTLIRTKIGFFQSNFFRTKCEIVFWDKRAGINPKVHKNATRSLLSDKYRAQDIRPTTKSIKTLASGQKIQSQYHTALL